MNQQQLKEYTRLNLQHNGLKIADADKGTAEQFERSFSSVRTADRNWAYLPTALYKKRADGGFYYSNMSLTYWALLVCLPLLAMFLGEHFKEGTTLMIGEWFFCLAYILPAIFLVVRLFLFSFVNIGHLILLVLCAVLSAVKIRIFGSEMNWIWVFVAVGTVLTLAGRIWEYFHKVRGNVQWYQKMVKTIKAGDSAMEQADALYRSIGITAKKELAQKFPGHALSQRLPWFTFSRKLKDDLPDIPKPTLAGTDFVHQKKSSDTTEETEARTVRTIITISNQSLGYQTIDKTVAATKFINPGKVQPFFGMAAAELSDDLEYRVYAHRWSQSEEVQIQNHYVQTTHIKNKEKERVRWEMASKEWDYLGTTADNAQIHSGSWGEYALYQDYLNKKQAMLDRIPDTIGIQHLNTDYHQSVRHSEHFEVALLAVTTADGSLVGLYSGQSAQAIAFCAHAAKQHWGIQLSPTACPSSMEQTAYLYQSFIL